MQMGSILVADDPLKPTLSEASLSYAPTVFVFVAFIAIVIYCAVAVKKKYFGKNESTGKLEESGENGDFHVS